MKISERTDWLEVLYGKPIALSGIPAGVHFVQHDADALTVGWADIVTRLAGEIVELKDRVDRLEEEKRRVKE